MIAIDVMGGDYAPNQILIGSLNAAKKSIPLILVGPEQLIRNELDILDPTWHQYPIQIQNATQEIKMDDEPVQSVRNKRDSSIVKMIELVKLEHAKVAVSAGNSGAVMVAANFILGKEAGIERPAIAGLLPTYSGEKVFALDLGANTECKAKHLYQFAELAYRHSPKILGLKKPRIGLLSNGQEDNKGSTLTKETFQLLKNSDLNFIGNVEPADIFNNKTDIVICDGFTGNVLLKTVEASVEMFAQMTQDSLTQEDMDKGTAESTSFQIENLTKGLLPSGGALLLGVLGNVVICHGNSNSQTITNTLINYSQFFQ